VSFFRALLAFVAAVLAAISAFGRLCSPVGVARLYSARLTESASRCWCRSHSSYKARGLARLQQTYRCSAATSLPPAGRLVSDVACPALASFARSLLRRRWLRVRCCPCCASLAPYYKYSAMPPSLSRLLLTAAREGSAIGRRIS